MPHSAHTLPLAHSLLSAGDALEVYDDGFESLDLNFMLTGGKTGHLAFVVTGESMVDSIKPGGVVVVDPSRIPLNGDIVVANINGANSVKIFKRDEQRLFLVPKNRRYATREITTSDTFHILGVVKGYIAVF